MPGRERRPAVEALLQDAARDERALDLVEARGRDAVARAALARVPGDEAPERAIDRRARARRGAREARVARERGARDVVDRGRDAFGDDAPE